MDGNGYLACKMHKSNNIHEEINVTMIGSLSVTYHTVRECEVLAFYRHTLMEIITTTYTTKINEIISLLVSMHLFYFIYFHLECPSRSGSPYPNPTI